MQISAIRRPASRPPRAAMPASTSVAPRSLAEMPSRSASAAATSSATRGAASAFTLTFGTASRRAAVMAVASCDRAPLGSAPARDELARRAAERIDFALRVLAARSFGEDRQDRGTGRDGATHAGQIATPARERGITRDSDGVASIDDADRAVRPHSPAEQLAELGYRTLEAREVPGDQARRKVVVVQLEGRGRPRIDLKRRHPVAVEQKVEPGQPAQTGDAHEPIEGRL